MSHGGLAAVCRAYGSVASGTKLGASADLWRIVRSKGLGKGDWVVLYVDTTSEWVAGQGGVFQVVGEGSTKRTPLRALAEVVER